MVAVSAVAKGFSDRHLFSDRSSVANIVYLATNRKLPLVIVVNNDNIPLISIQQLLYIQKYTHNHIDIQI
jgi:hypothetical protein